MAKKIKLGEFMIPYNETKPYRSTKTGKWVYPPLHNLKNSQK
jgi:hypothetical protein